MSIINPLRNSDFGVTAFVKEDFGGQAIFDIYRLPKRM